MASKHQFTTRTNKNKQAEPQVNNSLGFIQPRLQFFSILMKVKGNMFLIAIRFKKVEQG